MILNIVDFALFLIKEFVLPFTLFIIVVIAIILVLDDYVEKRNNKN